MRSLAMCDLVSHDRPGHDPVPHRRAPGVVGQAQPAHHLVRGEEPLRQDRQGQPLPQGNPRRGRRGGRQDRHLPGRAVPAAGQADRQAQSPGRRRPLHPGHHLAPAIRSRRPVLRTRLRLPRQPYRHPAQGPAATSASSKHPATPSPSPRQPDPHHARPDLTAQHRPRFAAARPPGSPFSGQGAGGSSPPSSTGQKRNSNSRGGLYSSKVQQPGSHEMPLPARAGPRHRSAAAVRS